MEFHFSLIEKEKMILVKKFFLKLRKKTDRSHIRKWSNCKRFIENNDRLKKKIVCWRNDLGDMRVRGPVPEAEKNSSHIFP